MIFLHNNKTQNLRCQASTRRINQEMYYRAAFVNVSIKSTMQFLYKSEASTNVLYCLTECYISDSLIISFGELRENMNVLALGAHVSSTSLSLVYMCSGYPRQPNIGHILQVTSLLKASSYSIYCLGCTKDKNLGAHRSMFIA